MSGYGYPGLSDNCTFGLGMPWFCRRLSDASTFSSPRVTNLPQLTQSLFGMHHASDWAPLESSIPDDVAALAAVLEHVPVMAWIADADAHCAFVNHRWLEFTGRTLDEQVGDGWRSGVHPDDREHYVEAFSSAHAARVQFEGECRYLTADGAYRVIASSGAPIIDAAGGFHGYIGSSIDITDARRTADELERASDHLRLVATNADEMIYRLRLLPEPKLEYMSPGALHIIGRSPVELLENRLSALDSVVEEDRHIIDEMLANPEVSPRAVMIRWRHPDGRIVWAQHLRFPIVNADGQMIAIEGVARDLTRQKQLEFERDGHAALLTSLIAGMHDGVLVESADGKVLLTNRAFCRLVKPARPEEFSEGADASGLLRRLGADQATLRRIRRSRRPRVDRDLLLPDGRVVEVSYTPLARDTEIHAYLWQFRDITARKLIEAELDASRQRQRDLAVRDDAVREEERRATARMLHDELGHLLTSIKLELTSAADGFREQASPHGTGLADRLQAATGLLDVSIATVQCLSAKMRAPDGPICEVLRHEASLFEQRTRIRCRVSIAPPRLQLDAERTSALHRIAREALTNVARHANAGAVRISLVKHRGLVVLSVSDNGRGMTAEALANPRSQGLLSMQERARALGGRFRITSGPRGGTVATVTVPVKQASPENRKSSKSA